jgi:MFS transporter, FSR family, fosmidomycin resistance protein
MSPEPPAASAAGPPAVAAPDSRPPAPVEVSAPGGATAPADRGVALWITSVAHGFNHLQGNMVNLLYPLMMVEMGFGYFQIGLLTTIFTLIANGLQAVCGLLTPYFRRSVILGTGNVLLAISTVVTGFAQNFGQLVATRIFAGIGTSPQHPVGSTFLVSLYPQARGKVLALHTTGGNVGTLVAPIVVGGLLLVVDWRTIFFIIAVPCFLFAFAYFFLPDRLPGAAGQKGGRRVTLDAYRACLRNRNLMLIAAVQMVGAAGRGQGIDIAFLMPHMVNDFGLDATAASLLIAVLQVGGTIGPLAIGWLSDRLPRNWVLVVSLALSAVTTATLALLDAPGPLLILNLLAYGIVVNSRLVLTQALVADAATGETADAAFSLYFFVGFITAPLWTLIFGAIMEAYGFTIGFAAMALTYLPGMLLVAFIRPEPPQPVARSA